MATLIAETSFIINGPDPIQLLKNEAIDRLASIVNDLPKYKKNLENLIDNFKIDDMLLLINHIDRDNEFKSSVYCGRYSEYFDEIEELIHKYLY
jgi:hypothetical protein